jgi:cytochrome c biogenesis protein CcmG/thiol:disulfide interchange protein DsbE
MRIVKWIAAVPLMVASAAITTAAPFGSVRTLDGNIIDTAGDVTIINYWATWCAPCRVEMPTLDSYYRQHHGQGLQMVAISIDETASPAKLRNVTGRYSFPVAQIGAVRMPRRDIPKAVPVTRVYDRSGRLVFQSKADGRSTIDAATLDRVVTPLLAGR